MKALPGAGKGPGSQANPHPLPDWGWLVPPKPSFSGSAGTPGSFCNSVRGWKAPPEWAQQVPLVLSQAVLIVQGGHALRKLSSPVAGAGHPKELWHVHQPLGPLGEGAGETQPPPRHLCSQLHPRPAGLPPLFICPERPAHHPLYGQLLALWLFVGVTPAGKSSWHSHCFFSLGAHCPVLRCLVTCTQ